MPRTPGAGKSPGSVVRWGDVATPDGLNGGSNKKVRSHSIRPRDWRAELAKSPGHPLARLASNAVDVVNNRGLILETDTDS